MEGTLIHVFIFIYTSALSVKGVTSLRQLLLFETYGAFKYPRINIFPLKQLTLWLYSHTHNTPTLVVVWNQFDLNTLCVVSSLSFERVLGMLDGLCKYVWR